MAKLENKSKDNPRLEQRLTADGQVSLYLEYYFGRECIPELDEYGEPVLYESGKMKGTPKYKIRHNRRKESLNLYLINNPRTPLERQQNKEILALAQKIRFEKEQDFLENREGYRLKKDRKVNFLKYYQDYLDKYTKKDIKMIKGAFVRFKDFLQDTPEYSKYSKYLQPEQITRDMIICFTEYLQSRSKGEGARSYYKRFKKVIKHAIEHDIIAHDPCKGITIKVDDSTLKKDILSADEISTLLATNDTRLSQEIRKAFIFCLYTGIRFCDIKDLTFANVDFSNNLIRFEQNKTKGHSANSGVTIPLHKGLVDLIGKPSNGNNKELIFNLPSHTMCLKSLRNWVKKAGINKHITWHCARHSFAVNILNNGANIKVLASLLGHSSIKHTEKYTRAVDSLKEQAINPLPELKF